MSPRRILVAVTGLTPQVLTETLFALAVRRDPPWIPDEVRVITTVMGAESLRLNLLEQPPESAAPPLRQPTRVPGLGWFHQLRRDYGLPEIAFDRGHMHVLSGGDDVPLDDIRTPAENTAAADQITEMIRGLTQQPTTELQVSIAGGRKTMGYYLGYALSLFGRPQDRLSHVLVSEPYESNREFYYPTPYSHPIHGRRGDREITVDARNAEVDLAEIPFVSLRHGLPEALLAGRSSFRATVEAATAALAPPCLVLDPRTRTAMAAGKLIRLPPTEFALLALFAHRSRMGAEPLTAPIKGQVDEDWSRRALSDLRVALGEFAVPDSVEQKLTEGIDGDYFSQHLSRLHRRLRQELGPAAAHYRILGGDSRPRRYRLGLAPEALQFSSVTEASAVCVR